MALSTSINCHVIPADHSRRFSIRASPSHHRPHTAKLSSATKKNQSINRVADSLSSLLHLNIQAPPKPSLRLRASTPTTSPKETIAEKWREIHGSGEWEGLLDPLDPWLRREIVKYGEFAQATYDAFDSDPLSDYCGSCRFNARKLFDEMRLRAHGYEVTKYLYAMSRADLPRWLDRPGPWADGSNWMGFVAVSGDEETRRIGRRDIAVAWRGTVAPSEWYEDLQRRLDPVGPAKVEHGFLSMYESKSEASRYNKSSASEQVMAEVRRIAEECRARGEEASLTVTGHSLGGALALLTAREAAEALPWLPVGVVSFGAPRVGDAAFRDELRRLGVRALRVAVRQDVVPRMPGPDYAHAGVELGLDARASPYLKPVGLGLNLAGLHSLETYLHLVDGFEGRAAGFRSGAKRDVALVNKSCDMLVEELRIPQNWYQLANKGLVCDGHGRWVKPKREPEDIPSPLRDSQQGHYCKFAT